MGTWETAVPKESSRRAKAAPNGQQRGDRGGRPIRGAERGSISSGCAHSVSSVTAWSCQPLTSDVTLQLGLQCVGWVLGALPSPHVMLWGGDTILGGPRSKAQQRLRLLPCAEALSPHRVWVCPTLAKAGCPHCPQHCGLWGPAATRTGWEQLTEGTPRRRGCELRTALRSPPGTPHPQARGIPVPSGGPLCPAWLPFSPDNFQPCSGRAVGTALTHGRAVVGVSVAQELPRHPTTGPPMKYSGPFGAISVSASKVP